MNKYIKIVIRVSDLLYPGRGTSSLEDSLSESEKRPCSAQKKSNVSHVQKGSPGDSKNLCQHLY